MSGKRRTVRVEILRGKVCGAARDLVEEYDKLWDELVAERKVVRELLGVIKKLDAEIAKTNPQRRKRDPRGRKRDPNSKEQRVREHLHQMLVPGTKVRRKKFQEITGIEISDGQFSRCKRAVLKEQGRYVPRKRRVVPGGGDDYVF